MPSVVLMENAGRGTADVLCGLGIGGLVVVCCGHGNNGGDGFVIARHLDLRGHAVSVLLAGDPAKLAGDALVNYRIIERSGLPIARVDSQAVDSKALAAELAAADWIVDALLGTGATGEPRSPYAEMIEAINASGRRVLAVDVPSGLDCDTGAAAARTIRAQHTCTFVADKVGFAASGARSFTGEIHVLDIGAPRKLVQRIAAVADRGQ